WPESGPFIISKGHSWRCMFVECRQATNKIQISHLHPTSLPKCGASDVVEISEGSMAVKAIVDEAVDVLIGDLKPPKPILVLEAGCGSTSDVELPFEKTIVGIDIDSEQLNHNDKLDSKIQGDLQTYELPRNAFDIVACVDVLEHLPFPEKAIANMSRSLKPGGYLLIAGPEPYSYKGLVAKYTPHSMRHIIFKLVTGRPAPELRRIHGNGQI